MAKTGMPFAVFVCTSECCGGEEGGVTELNHSTQWTGSCCKR